MKEFKNIDELFKEGLGSAEDHIAFNESDWDKLERRLDKKKKGIPVLWLATAGGIAAVLALVFVWLQYESLSLTKPEQTITKKNNTILGTDNQQKDNNVKQGTITEDKGEITATNPNSPGIDQQLVLNRKSDASSIYSFNSKKTIEQDNLALITSIDNGGISGNKQTNIPVVDTTRLTGKLSEPIAQIPPAPKRNPYLGKLTFSVGAAPALNGVNTLKGGDWGGDLGMALTIGLSKKWSFTTGVIYAKKVYSTGYENYNPVNPPSVSYKPTSVDADCRVLDIPLNINYKLYSNKQNEIKLSTGLSSYMMLKEDYSFNYNNPYYPSDYVYEVRNENKHWLGVVNASVEYQRKINSTMSIGIQPFVKIPLDGVGYSRVKLKTAGVAVKLNIDLGKGKKKE